MKIFRPAQEFPSRCGTCQTMPVKSTCYQQVRIEIRLPAYAKCIFPHRFRNLFRSVAPVCYFDFHSPLLITLCKIRTDFSCASDAADRVDEQESFVCQIFLFVSHFLVYFNTVKYPNSQCNVIPTSYMHRTLSTAFLKSWHKQLLTIHND